MWIDQYRDPQHPPNPEFPNGIDIDASMGQERTCKVDLPYPAKRIGYYVIECEECGMRTAITTAGRPDDPKSVKLPCKVANLEDNQTVYN